MVNAVAINPSESRQLCVYYATAAEDVFEVTGGNNVSGEQFNLLVIAHAAIQNHMYKVEGRYKDPYFDGADFSRTERADFSKTLEKLVAYGETQYQLQCELIDKVGSGLDIPAAMKYLHKVAMMAGKSTLRYDLLYGDPASLV